MARYGLVEMRKDQRRVRPVVTVSEFQIRAAAWSRFRSSTQPARS